MDKFYFVTIFWIILFLAIWIFIRKRHPELIGLDKNRNKQKIDSVKLKSCPNCKKGFLEPQFNWWRYCFGVIIPPGIIYIIGEPNNYQCTNCNEVVVIKDGAKFFTRISLTYRLRSPFILAFLVYGIVAALMFTIYFQYFG